MVRSSLLFNLNYNNLLSSKEAIAEAVNYGLVVSKNEPKFTNWHLSCGSEKLRVGFVSGDFYNHPVGYFLEGLVEKLDSSSFELFAFPSLIVNDDLTNRIMPFFKEWVPIFGMPDFDAATIIHNFDIDILIDLSGHTYGNRLSVFSYKPAPVQMSWLGYFATTGLREMDYFLGDPHMLPEGEENHFIENVWRLSESWLCLKPPNFQIEVSVSPLKKNGFCTFGSFGNISKINDQVVEVWASVLSGTPRSKLFIKANQLIDSLVVDDVQKRFEVFGIGSDRLILEGASSRLAYFEAYNEIDLVLDTFPYPGGTTSIDALWMGVPVLTLKGDRFLSHLGESIAINAGNQNWIAKDIEEYITKAVNFSLDSDRHSQSRSSFRDRILKSPLFDTDRFARCFGDALWGMWRHSQAN